MNAKMLMQGRSNHPLNETGIAQAEEAAERFAEMGVKIDRVYTSPLIRAVQTAEQILKRSEDGGRLPDIIKDNRLIEMDYGPYEGMDLTDPAPEVMAFFMDFAGTPAPDGMEQLSTVVSRLGDFLEEIREEARSGNVLLSTHAIAMKGALEYLTPGSDGSYWSKYIGNCDIYVSDVTDQGYGVPHKLR